MRLAVLLVSLILSLTGCALLPATYRPSGPSIQIEIPQVAGWNLATDDAERFEDFHEALTERIETSQGVIQFQAIQRQRDGVIVTLAGDNAEQMLAVMLPYLKQAGLPPGSKISKNGSEPVALQP